MCPVLPARTDAEARAGLPPLVLDAQRSNKRYCDGGWNGYACRRRTCSVCGPRRARLLGRVLVLDAEVDPPTHCMTLTTRDPDTGSQRFREGVAYVFQRRDGLRAYWDAEYFAKVEFTTGWRARDGLRRMHAHFLLKGLSGADVLNVERIARERWEAVTGAFRVEVAQLRTPTAALHYLGLHHAKREQLPPAEWRGMAERASKGYWSRPVGELRAEARAQLWAESLAWLSGLGLSDARLLVDGAVAAGALRRIEVAAAREALAEMTRAGYGVRALGEVESPGGCDVRQLTLDT